MYCRIKVLQSFSLCEEFIKLCTYVTNTILQNQSVQAPKGENGVKIDKFSVKFG